MTAQPPSLELVDQAAPPANFDIAVLSDLGTNRENNEDACGFWIESADTVVLVVADGIGGYEGGEVASQMAVEITLASYRESPPAWGPAKRLARAVQRANIEIHNRALTVPELRRMGTTLTAIAVSDGMLHAAHVGDCRVYLIRRNRIKQITKDHTMVQEKVRMGMMSAARARTHPERSALTRSVGHELIVSVDRITLPLLQHDRILVCSDGLHGVLEDHELEQVSRGLRAEAACSRLIEVANERGTADNLTVGFFTMDAPTGHHELKPPLWRRLTRIFSRSAALT
ncbi:MAG TPA: protein phosphatase 2C domain-containing protein [Candidatus Binataceae bacterium]|nr:protein phosphatase 2C domain-containing protein [Candidatus Binataceae bacterium]